MEKKGEGELGIAFVIDGISNNHRNYFAKGGYELIIGDGNLNYDTENIPETFY